MTPPTESSTQAQTPLRGTGVAACAAVAFGAGLLVSADESMGRRVLHLILVAGLCLLVALSLAPRIPRALTGVTFLGLAVVSIPCAAATWYAYRGATAAPVYSLGSVILLLGGALAIWVGVAALWATKKTVIRVLIVPLVVLSAYGLAVPVAIATYATTSAGDPGAAGPPICEGDPDFDTVTLRTADGVELAGWYTASSNRAGILLAHGASSDSDSLLDHSKVLSDAGFGVLLVDARGHGRSRGEAMKFGWFGDADLRAGLDYLVARQDLDPNRIGALGVSMGGEEVIGTFAVDSRMATAVAEGATGRTYADKAWLDDVYGLRGRFQQVVDSVMYSLTDLLTPASPPTSLRDAVARGAPRPVLLIAAGNERDEVHAADEIKSASPTNVDVWVVPGGNHTSGLTTRPTEWSTRVTGFFIETLLASA